MTKEAESLVTAAKFARSAIDCHLGDSDPPNGSDDPLFLACQKLSAALDATPAPSGRDPATIEACAKIASNAYNLMFPKPSNRITAENAGHAVARSIRALAAPAVLTEER